MISPRGRLSFLVRCQWHDNHYEGCINYLNKIILLKKWIIRITWRSLWKGLSLPSVTKKLEDWFVPCRITFIKTQYDVYIGLVFYYAYLCVSWNMILSNTGSQFVLATSHAILSRKYAAPMYVSTAWLYTVNMNSVHTNSYTHIFTLYVGYAYSPAWHGGLATNKVFVKYIYLLPYSPRTWRIYCCHYFKVLLIHWGWVTHICISKLTSVGSDNQQWFR